MAKQKKTNFKARNFNLSRELDYTVNIEPYIGKANRADAVYDSGKLIGWEIKEDL